MKNLANNIASHNLKPYINVIKSLYSRNLCMFLIFLEIVATFTLFYKLAINLIIYFNFNSKYYLVIFYCKQLNYYFCIF